MWAQMHQVERDSQSGRTLFVFLFVLVLLHIWNQTRTKRRKWSSPILIPPAAMTV